MIDRKVRLENGRLARDSRGALAPLEEGEVYVCSASEAQAYAIPREQYITDEELAALLQPGLQEAQQAAIIAARLRARRLLAETDYKIIRQAEQAALTGPEYSALKAQRQAVRDACNALEAQISACADAAQVTALMQDGAP